MYLNDADLCACMEEIANLIDLTSGTIYIKESVSNEGRLTLNKFFSEDLKQAYAMGYNEAVDDVNAYIESCDESYDDDYSAVEDAIMNESNRVKKLQNSWGAQKEWDNLNALKKKIGLARFNKQ